MKSNNHWLVISLIIVLSLLLASCSSQATPTPAAQATPVPPATPAIQATQASPVTQAAPAASNAFLTINFEQFPTWVRNFNPFSATPLGSTLTAIYEPMMIYNKATGKLVPWLATDYSWNTDNTLLTFKLRQAVKWSDGQPFTAQDVIYTFNLLKGNNALIGVGSTSTLLENYIDSVTAPDDLTVVFKFKSVYTLSLYDLADQFIVPQHIWMGVADPLTWTNDNPIGTGPFTQVTKFDTQIYVLEKNPYYWQPGKPAFQGIRYPVFADNDSSNLALVNGDLDWAGNFVPDIEKTFVSKNPANNHYYFVGANMVMLYINPSIKPFDNPDVRKAISMGIDRKMIVQTAEYNYIPPADATGLGDIQATWKDPAAVAAGTWTNYDVTTANQMLDSAGLKRGADGTRLNQQGKPMEYTLTVPSGWTDWISACQIISQNMSALGIKIDVQTPDQNTWTDAVSKGQHEWTLDTGDLGPTPYNFYLGQMSQLTVQPIGQSSNDNFNRYVSPDADKILALFGQTSDPVLQKQYATQLEALFVKEAPALPLFPGVDWYEYSTARFNGFPSKDNPYAPGVPWPGGPYNTALIVLTTITPK